MAVLVTGGAGFVAHTLIGRLILNGEQVIAFDNLSRGTLANVKPWMGSGHFEFRQADISNLDQYRSTLATLLEEIHISEVWHLAANSDIPAGVANPDLDLRDTFLSTFNTLKLMEEFGIGSLLFASSSAIYGDLKDTLLTEDTGPLLPISNYGAMKLASEAAIAAAAERFLEKALIFRFPNVVGVPATHGILLDFLTRLKQTPECLQVLGNGTQRKSYLHVSELVDAMLFLKEHVSETIDVFNIGPLDGGITVRRIAEEVVTLARPGTEIRYQSGNKGWVGDVPRFRYSTAKLQQLGWTPSLDSLEAIRKAAAEILSQIS